MKKQLFAGAALAALIAPHGVWAQSTGTVSAEEIVVTGTRAATGVSGVIVPDAPKARTVLSNEVLRQQAPGQTLLQAINTVPSVNFTNNDPFGSSGGNVRIRGFDGNRISFTWDGLPLNDTGNYAIFSNQTLDPEIIEQVNVNQGTTDVDSPTAASSGGTINYRTYVPRMTYGGLAVGSVGESYSGRRFERAFGMLETGDIFGTGIRGFVSASSATNRKFRGPGDINKEQYNIRLYKELATNGDFVSIAGHLNRNRNASYRALTLAQANLDLQQNGRFTFDNNPLCARPTPGVGVQNDNATPQPSTAIPTNYNVTYFPGAAPAPAGVDNSCTNYYGVRINPSNTGNARFNSKFTLSDRLVFTLDAGYQYVLANGGGFSTLSETSAQARGGLLPAGRDLNGDGDTADTVAFYTPNTTNTDRYTVLSSLRYDFSPDQYVRVAYAFDYGRHRQTGEWTSLDPFGTPINVFGGRTAAQRVFDGNGYYLRQRDRFSIAELNQVSGEYRGRFFDRRLEVQLGLRAPFFHRELNQYCYTQVSNGNAFCTGAQFGPTPVAAQGNFFVVAPGTTFTGTVPAGALYAPFRQTYNYRKVLPNVGFTFRPADRVQVYAGYAKGLSAPRTDNLYRAPFVDVAPETTDNFDVGIRYVAPRVQAVFGGFSNRFQNRIVTSFDQQQGISVDRNVGRVQIRGLEASVDAQPVRWLSVRGFGSYIDAKLKDNIALGLTPAGAVGVTPGLPVVALTAGKRLVETPEWQYGARAAVTAGPFVIGASYKHVTSRYATDVNDVVLPGYTTVDADIRLSLENYGLKRTFLQLNAVNLFDRQYLGSINSQIAVAGNPTGQITNLPVGTAVNYGGANPTFQPAAPRALVLSLQVGF